LTLSASKRYFNSSQPKTNFNSYKIVKTMTKYIWPKGDIRTKSRVLLALVLLLGAKGILVTVPYIFKLSIDSLAITNNLNLMNGAGALLIGYGVARITSIIMQEMRNSIFSSVAQSAIRRASKQTFAQLISLDSDFHVSRQTGGLVSAINRGLLSLIIRDKGN
jgi:ABC transporter ATM